MPEAIVAALTEDVLEGGRVVVDVGGLDPYGDEALAGLTITPTEACTVATALLHSQSLSPFEFSVWFSSSGR